MRGLPVDHRGYPVPRFVEWIDGKPDFRVMDAVYLARCVALNLCWICGGVLGKHKIFVIGPMCAVNHTSAEPPSHRDCAEFAARACPFLTLPKAVRREANLPADGVKPAGIMIDRNPGVTLLWLSTGYKTFRSGTGRHFDIGTPAQVWWYARGRAATRAEIMESIDSGMPILQGLADAQGADAQAELVQRYADALRLVPAA